MLAVAFVAALVLTYWTGPEWVGVALLVAFVVWLWITAKVLASATIAVSAALKSEKAKAGR